MFDGQPHAEVSVRVLDALSWFWSWTHRRVREQDDEAGYRAAQAKLLSALSEMSMTFQVCLHYLTNHLWEDYVEYGPLFFLTGEAGEASHARDNRMKWPTLRGREYSGDSWNTWACMLRNLLAIHSLRVAGTLSR